MKKRINAARAIKIIAVMEGVTVEEVREAINLAVLAGLCSQDPAIRARWKKIPCKDRAPTPEELIIHLATLAAGNTNPFE